MYTPAEGEGDGSTLAGPRHRVRRGPSPCVPVAFPFAQLEVAFLRSAPTERGLIHP